MMGVLLSANDCRIDSAFETARRLREKNPSDGPVTIADVWDNPVSATFSKQLLFSQN